LRLSGVSSDANRNPLAGRRRSGAGPRKRYSAARGMANTGRAEERFI